MSSQVTLTEYGRRTFDSSERRGMHLPMPPTLEEMQTKAHAEVSEVFEAWLNRERQRYSTGGGINLIVQQRADGYTWEWIEDDGKPEGVAAELADVVLTLTYIAHRWPEFTLERIAWGYGGHSSVVAMLRDVHFYISGMYWGGTCSYQAIKAIIVCEVIAARLGIDLDAAIERKAAYNDVRPATEKRL